MRPRCLCHDMECRRLSGCATDATSITCKNLNTNLVLVEQSGTFSNQLICNYSSGTLTKRGQHMRTTCTAALATAAGDTLEWSLKIPQKEVDLRRV